MKSHESATSVFVIWRVGCVLGTELFAALSGYDEVVFFCLSGTKNHFQCSGTGFMDRLISHHHNALVIFAMCVMTIK